MVYNGGENLTGDKNFTGATIMGHITVEVPRARVTAMPGFSTSYKQAATNQITLATMDPAYSGEKAAYYIRYVPNEG